MRNLAWILLFGFLFDATVLQAYSIPVHDRLPDVLLHDTRAGVEQVHSVPNDAGLIAFRHKVYTMFAQTPDATLRTRFLKRYPSSESFGAVQFKEFFGMAATHPALGFDPYAEVAAHKDAGDPHAPVQPGEAKRLVDWVRIGSNYPDLDWRNRGRWWVVGGTYMRTKDGQRIPFDPVILNMGRTEELSGQAHAHYGLNRNPKSSDPEVLKKHPADFAVPIGSPDDPVLTFAPERAQAYGDLAVLAASLGEPALAAVFAGNAFHYLADVANQIHTIQVGIYEFFVDATLQSYKLKLLCLWGLLCEVRPFKDIGIDMIMNHHTWSEEMTRIALERGMAGRPYHAALANSQMLFSPDESLASEWQSALAQRASLREMADRIILAGNVEGPEIYRLTRQITKRELRKAGVAIDFSTKPDAVVLSYLNADINAPELNQFFVLESRGLKRAATAMHAWWLRNLAPGANPDVTQAIERLLRQQLDELDAAELRRKRWIEKRGGLQEAVPL